MHTNYVHSLIPSLLIASAIAGCGVSRLAAPPVDVTSFAEIPISYRHHWDRKTHPFTGAAVIDVDGDNRSEVFVGGGNGQVDALFTYKEGRLEDIIAGTGLSNLSATHGATSLDMDDDGDVDLLVARDDGVYLYLNNGAVFEQRKIPVNLPENAVALDVAVSDIDQDGDGDLYVSVFVDFPSFKSATYNDPAHAKSNRMLQNNGDLTFTDITASSGTASKQNSFVSVFVDLDGDNWQDLVVAQNTGEVEIFRNRRDSSFESIRVDQGYGFWMGVAVGDIDNDGDQDLFFTNVGTSIPSFLIKGDLRDDQAGSSEWLLLRNDGQFKFANVTAQYGLHGHGFAWGAAFEDLNFDGHLDLLVAQNYIKWPIHRYFKLAAKSFLQLSASDASRQFFQIDALGLSNKYFGQSPLMADLDGDGRQDTLWINMDGPVRAFINSETGNFVTVRLPNSVASLGTRVSVQTATGRSYTKHVLNSVGLLTDQSKELTFGLGTSQAVRTIQIVWPNGRSQVLTDPPINRTIAVRY